MNRTVSLITMPWGQPIQPNLLMGNLHSTLENEYITVSFSLHFEFLNYIGRHGYGIYEYQAVIGCYGLGDFIFSIPPLKDKDLINDDLYHDYLDLQGVSKNTINIAFKLRELAQEFIKYVLNEISEENIVVFCPMYRELTPSLVLAKLIKERNSDIKIIFAGEVQEGRIEKALKTEYKFINSVISSEPEKKILDEIAKINNSFAKVVVDKTQAKTNSKPSKLTRTPCFDEYFFRIKESSLYQELKKLLWIPYEFSRGCWWAEKSKCSFCALTKSNSTYRGKDVESAVNGMIELSNKYKLLKFQIFDWITPKNSVLFEKLYNEISDKNCDFTIYLQSKVNLTKEQLLLLKKIGAVVQFGIESLDTDELKRIKKGSTALHNIRALKWCAELDIRAEWNILFGLPSEKLNKYKLLYKILPSLYHLWPPSFNRFRLQQLSPFFEEHKNYGIEITGPLSWYKYVYSNLSSNGMNFIAEEFEYEKSEEYYKYECFEDVKEQIKLWNKNSRYSYGKLRYICGPCFISIVDLRFADGRREYFLNQLKSFIYLLCDPGISIDKIYTILKHDYKVDIQKEEILEFLTEMVVCKLMYTENNCYLSLALAETPHNYEKMLLRMQPKKISLVQ